MNDGSEFLESNSFKDSTRTANAAHATDVFQNPAEALVQ
jgi:hypothetical protein